MFRNFLRVASAVTVMTLGVALSFSYAGPQQNPWGASEEDVIENPAHQDNPDPAAMSNEHQHANTDAASDEPRKVDMAGDKKEMVADQKKPDASDAKKPPDIDKDTKTEVVPAGKKLVGRVVWVKGTMTAKQPEEEPRILKKHSNLYMGDELVTQDKTTSQIIYTDDSSVTFRANTTYKINDYEYVPKDQRKNDEKPKGKYVMDLVKGGFRTVTGIVAKENPDDYKVVTPVATIGVRGTEYSVVYEKGKELFIKRYEGDPCVTGGSSKEDQKTLCLDQDVEFGAVKDGEQPVALGEQPDVFTYDVEVVPVSFGQGGGSFTPTGGSGLDGLGGGSGFCIQ